MKTQHDQLPEGYFVSKWIGISILICSIVVVSIGILLEKPGILGLGPAIGVGIGSIIGQRVEKRKEALGLIRPLTPAEKKKQKTSIIAGIVLLIIGLVLALSLYN